MRICEAIKFVACESPWYGKAKRNDFEVGILEYVFRIYDEGNGA